MLSAQHAGGTPPDARFGHGALPDAAKHYLNRIEDLCGVPIVAISTGPERDQTILRMPV